MSHNACCCPFVGTAVTCSSKVIWRVTKCPKLLPLVIFCRKMTESIDRRFTFEITALERYNLKIIFKMINIIMWFFFFSFFLLCDLTCTLLGWGNYFNFLATVKATIAKHNSCIAISSYYITSNKQNILLYLTIIRWRLSENLGKSAGSHFVFDNKSLRVIFTVLRGEYNTIVRIAEPIRLLKTCSSTLTLY